MRMKPAMILPLIRVDIGNNKNRWFWDKDEAVVFACAFFNIEEIAMNHPPIYECRFSLEPKDICKFLNEKEIK
mgnify:CR=1 FL=1